MTRSEEKNRAIMMRWYDAMWGGCDSSEIVNCMAPQYRRHSLLGADDIVDKEIYSARVDSVAAGEEVNDFAYLTIVEGDFVATLGCYIFGSGDKSDQWDWVQLFRMENHRLAETWLVGMGASKLKQAIPSPANAWNATFIPGQHAVGMSDTKYVVKQWYEHLAAGTDGAACLQPDLSAHDMRETAAKLSAAEFQARWRDYMQQDKATDMHLFLIEENDMVVATGLWRLGDDRREWNWVQGFRMQDGLIAESWITSIGGTDTSIAHSPQIKWDASVLPANSVRFGTDVD